MSSFQAASDIKLPNSSAHTEDGGKNKPLASAIASKISAPAMTAPNGDPVVSPIPGFDVLNEDDVLDPTYKNTVSIPLSMNNPLVNMHNDKIYPQLVLVDTSATKQIEQQYWKFNAEICEVYNEHRNAFDMHFANHREHRRIGLFRREEYNKRCLHIVYQSIETNIRIMHPWMPEFDNVPFYRSWIERHFFLLTNIVNRMNVVQLQPSDQYNHMLHCCMQKQVMDWHIVLARSWLKRINMMLCVQKMVDDKGIPSAKTE